MGLFSRRKDKESAMSQADMAQVEAGATPTTTNPVTTPAAPLGIGTPVGGGGTIADEVNKAAGGDLQQQLAGLMSLMSQHAVDLRSQPMEVREAVAADCRAQGVDMQVGQSLNITDPKQIHIVVDVLKKHGLLPASVTVN
jgi:hypothetical protein